MKRVIRQWPLVFIFGMLLVVSSARADEAADAKAASGWKAGAAAIKITPDKPLILLGFSDRAGVFTGVNDDIYAKALALEDSDGNRGVIVTADLVGFQAAVTSDPVCRRLEEKTGLKREQIILNASHTHTGPVVSLHPNLLWNVAHPPMTEADAENVVEYTRQLQDKLVEVVVEALSKLEPATLSWGKGEAGFVMSRRMPTPHGVVMAANPDGLTDKTVPVLRVEGADGKIRAVLFGAACHSVAMGAQNVISADYPGYAQAYIQQEHPGAIALFMAGAGADANPHPWGGPHLAAAHGESLGKEVCRVLASPDLAELDGPLRTTMSRPELPLQKLSRQEIEALLPLPNFQARTAQQMIALLDAGQELLTTYAAPVAVWHFADDLRLVALPAEPVAEYVPLIQEAIGAEKLWIAGFNNDCFGYLPTATVVKEGGHEAIGITLWAWGTNLHRNVGFFAPEVQDVIVATVKELAGQGEPPTGPAQ